MKFKGQDVSNALCNSIHVTQSQAGSIAKRLSEQEIKDYNAVAEIVSDVVRDSSVAQIALGIIKDINVEEEDDASEILEANDENITKYDVGLDNYYENPEGTKDENLDPNVESDVPLAKTACPTSTIKDNESITIDDVVEDNSDTELEEKMEETTVADVVEEVVEHREDLMNDKETPEKVEKKKDKKNKNKNK